MTSTLRGKMSQIELWVVSLEADTWHIVGLQRTWTLHHLSKVDYGVYQLVFCRYTSKST